MAAKKSAKKATPEKKAARTPPPPMPTEELKKKYTTKSGATDWVKVRGDMLAAYAKRGEQMRTMAQTRQKVAGGMGETRGGATMKKKRKIESSLKKK